MCPLIRLAIAELGTQTSGVIPVSVERVFALRDKKLRIFRPVKKSTGTPRFDGQPQLERPLPSLVLALKVARRCR